MLSQQYSHPDVVRLPTWNLLQKGDVVSIYLPFDQCSLDLKVVDRDVELDVAILQ